MATKNLSILFIILMSMIGQKSSAYDFAVENADGKMIYYNYINDGKELEVTFKDFNNYNSYSGSVIIPEEVTYMNSTRKVTSIGYRAFSGCSGLTSVTIPNSVTSIDRNAFEGCRDLTSVTIPNSVTSIGQFAFKDCTALTTITIPNSVTNIEVGTFQNCKCLTSITIGNSVTSIRGSAFSGCSSLTSVMIPNSVTSIGGSAFSGCSGLTSIMIPNSVTSISVAAFWQCSSLTSISIPNSVTDIGNEAFRDCTSLTSITIPCSVTSIAPNLFSGCINLTSITIPNSVTSIGGHAFYKCTGLTSITIPNSVTSIEYYAFKNCSGLTSITIPNSVTSIGIEAFYGCNLEEVISKIENPFDIKTSTFSYNTFLNASLFVPKGTIDKYKATEGWKKFLFIEEGNGNGGTTQDPSKCEKPTINYKNGQLTFTSATEGAEFVTDITDADIKTHYSSTISLTATYNIRVYATKAGYENSETATATLCWIDQEPRTEGVSTDGIANIPANAVLIQTSGSTLTVQGADDGTQVMVYTSDGTQAGSAVSRNGQAEVNTNLRPGSVVIVKIGEKAVKVVMK